MQTGKRFLSILLALLVLAGTAVAIGAFVIPSAEDLLLEAIETTETITDGHAILEVAMEMPEQSMSGTVEAWGRLDAGPNGEPAFRVEVLTADEADLIGTIAVSDGSELWVWNPAENTVLTGQFEELYGRIAEEMAGRDFDHNGDLNGEHGRDFDREHNFDEADVPETPEEAVAKLLEYFTVERAGSDVVGETAVNSVRLIPIPEQMPDEVRAAGGLLNIWLRNGDSVPVGIEYVGSAFGSGVARATFLEINQGVDDAVFTFTIPEGATVIDAADLELPEVDELEEAVASEPDFALLTPAILPEGAILHETTNVGGAVVERYGLDNGRSFTIAQGRTAVNLAPSEGGESVTVRGVDGMMYEDAENGDGYSRTLLNWTEGDIQYWVGGDLTSAEALAIANSLQ
jgi:outer membrane lipoprotein-sorting protein